MARRRREDQAAAPLETVNNVHGFPGGGSLGLLGAAEGIKLQHRLKWVAPQGAESKLDNIQLDYEACPGRYRVGGYSA